MKRKSELIVPFQPVEKLMKQHTTLRISVNSVKALTEELIRRGKIISTKAHDIACHSGRKTVVDKDVKLAYDQRNI